MTQIEIDIIDKQWRKLEHTFEPIHQLSWKYTRIGFKAIKKVIFNAVTWNDAKSFQTRIVLDAIADGNEELIQKIKNKDTEDLWIINSVNTFQIIPFVGTLSKLKNEMERLARFYIQRIIDGKLNWFTQRKVK